MPIFSSYFSGLSSVRQTNYVSDKKLLSTNRTPTREKDIEKSERGEREGGEREREGRERERERERDSKEREKKDASDFFCGHKKFILDRRSSTMEAICQIT